jgi:hypothetical protein
MTMTTPVLSLAVLLPVAAGCVRPSTSELNVAIEPAAPDSAAEPVEVRAVALADDHSDDEASEPVAPDHRVLPAQHPFREPTLFRLGAGYGALGHVNLAPCREQGLQGGYLHLRVTFRGDGRVARATVESHLPPPPEALGCIGEQLEAALVPVFDGDAVTLARSFFVN